MPLTLAIFCKVVDNFGDIGICWRFARQLRAEHGVDVTLWVDDLRSFQRLCPEVVIDADVQQVQGVTVRHWPHQDLAFTAEDVADVVVEFFAVDIPPAYVEAMAQRAVKPVWINFEGLSAEDWVEGCHALPSMHPRLPLTKYFFFPGFTTKTGGLLREAGLIEERDRFQNDPAAQAEFLAGLGVTEQERAGQLVSLFCYPHAPVAELFAVWERQDRSVTCLVPVGVARDAVSAFIGGEATAGAARMRGALTVRVIPFVPQPDYDRVLWCCDVNFVRGEDSWVRAQWAARPFVWHIYPQEENLHHKKLRAFLQRFAPALPALQAFSLMWNGAADATPASIEACWKALRAELPAVSMQARAWQSDMAAQPGFTSQFLALVHAKR
ncbi:elongation factor P maturation arginine rhamnosyltransferase EarP [Massilia arenosa]|uniref:Protein-arginine rhamnosyltransferase n=1 Tax=Zemynaea arenosa TaxID=2561931 RepID=A0A4Y9RWN4_9BURK|nr:elongation factor P maturation arginine rhamnosyltransferase EarP [Massilia arenosa]TFW11698.1 elongation factor P maturation arginine rhamnosyltransferase EarP [Massilia arenosa]